MEPATQEGDVSCADHTAKMAGVSSPLMLFPPIELLHRDVRGGKQRSELLNMPFVDVDIVLANRMVKPSFFVKCRHFFFRVSRCRKCRHFSSEGFTFAQTVRKWSFFSVCKMRILRNDTHKRLCYVMWFQVICAYFFHKCHACANFVIFQRKFFRFRKCCENRCFQSCEIFAFFATMLTNGFVKPFDFRSFSHFFCFSVTRAKISQSRQK